MKFCSVELPWSSVSLQILEPCFPKSAPTAYLHMAGTYLGYFIAFPGAVWNGQSGRCKWVLPLRKASGSNPFSNSLVKMNPVSVGASQPWNCRKPPNSDIQLTRMTCIGDPCSGTLPAIARQARFPQASSSTNHSSSSPPPPSCPWPSCYHCTKSPPKHRARRQLINLCKARLVCCLLVTGKPLPVTHANGYTMASGRAPACVSFPSNSRSRRAWGATQASPCFLPAWETTAWSCFQKRTGASASHGRQAGSGAATQSDRLVRYMASIEDSSLRTAVKMMRRPFSRGSGGQFRRGPLSPLNMCCSDAVRRPASRPGLLPNLPASPTMSSCGCYRAQKG